MPGPLERGRELRRFGITNASVAFFPDGRRAVCASGNNIRLLDVDLTERRQFIEGDVEEGPEQMPPVGHEEAVVSVVFSPDGLYLLSAGQDRTVRLWDMETTKELHRRETNLWVVSRIPSWFVFSSNTRRALWAARDDGPGEGHAELLDLAGGRPLPAFSLGGMLEAVALSPDAHRVLSCDSSHAGLARLWDAETGQELRRLGEVKNISAVAFSHDGRRAYLCGGEYTAECEVETGEERRRLKWSFSPVTVFSADGRHAYSGDKAGYVWETETDPAAREWKPRAFPKWHTAGVIGLALAPDGKTLATSDGGRLVLWDVPAGTKRQEWHFPIGINGLAFAPDGRHLATANGNGTVYILRLGR
jgi:WD40 repeat protein